MKKLKDPKVWLPMAGVAGLSLLILVGALFLNFLKRPRAWQPLDPDAYYAVTISSNESIVLFSDHAEDFIRLINDQITTRSTASTEGYGGGFVTLYGSDGFTTLLFSRYYMYLTRDPSGKLTFRPNDWRCGQELVVRMKELCKAETDAQPLPTAGDVHAATLTQNGSTTALDAEQLANFCTELQLLHTQTVTKNLYLKPDDADWLVTLQLQDNLELEILYTGHYSTEYVQLKFYYDGNPLNHGGRVYRLDSDFDAFAALPELLVEP